MPSERCPEAHLSAASRGKVPRRRGPLLSVFSIFCSLVSLLTPAKGPEVIGLTYRFQNRMVLATFQVSGAFERNDVKEALLSTRPITITYSIQLLKDRTLWKDKVLVKKRIKRTVYFDNLTRQFRVETVMNGAEPESRVLDSWDELVDFLESVKDAPLVHVADLEAEENLYQIRARVHFLSDSFLWIIPWDLETPWETIPLKTL